MIAKKMEHLVKNSSMIRAMFEEGKKMAIERGEDNVYDFSLGNPSVNPPHMVKEALIDIINNEDENLLHGYMSNSGYEDVRRSIASSINATYGTKFDETNIIMTVGAAGGLNVILKTILNPGDEVVVCAPYFGEYSNYISNYDGLKVVVEPNLDTFEPDLEDFERKITPNTKAVIVNTPNNPTGVIYSEDTIKKIADILDRKSKEYNTVIYLISDEPYRELVYGGEKVPYITKYYNNTIVGYSYSKSLSLPGERIGYLVIPSELTYYNDIFDGASVANRILGFVNAPSLIQRVIMKCQDAKVDIEIYNKNRLCIYENLTRMGFECIEPKGAFYLFIKAPNGDDVAMADIAKKHGILIVPGTAFGCKGYCRLAYCVSFDKLERSISEFEKLAKELIV